ncbi:DEAD/DEAH box helicase family protein [Synechococcus sp. AH-224-I15]|nr:DEAD/DEAH box helicase family protein [Synechococcus sp. AH-224-I15]
MSEEFITFQFNLGELMEQYKLNAAAIAAGMGRTPRTISNWAKRSTPPSRGFSRATATQLAAVLTDLAGVDISADDLTTQVADPKIVAEVRLAKLMKPQWMSPSDWAEFGLRYRRDDGTFGCALTAKKWAKDGRIFIPEALPEANTFDHIVAKHNGGTDDLDNIQPAEWDENCRQKRINPDPWWSQPSYFDTPITAEQVDRLRVSQVECGIKSIERLAELVRGSRSRYGGNLLINDMCVRSGKFLTGAIVLPRAINQQIIDKHGPQHPRVKTVLILTKEAALRDQFIREANEEPVKLGLADSNPRVLPITSDAKSLRERNEPAASIRQRYDIAIGCIQTFFEKKPGAAQSKGEDRNPQLREELVKFLAIFDLVIIDEPQFAQHQWRALLKHLTHAMTIGMTGTPLEPEAVITRERLDDGSVREAFNLKPLLGDSRGGVYRMASWTANDSDDYDFNLKQIPQSQEQREHLVIEAGDKYLKTTYPNEVKENEGNANCLVHYGGAVAKHALQGVGLLQDRDRLWRKYRDTSGQVVGELADHRKQQTRKDANGNELSFSPELVYPPHLIIVSKGISNCEKLAEQIQRDLPQWCPELLPEDGWNVETIHSGNVNGNDAFRRRRAEVYGSNTPEEAKAILASEGIYDAKPLTIPADLEEPGAADKVHPFMRSWLVHKGKNVDAKCARILVTDGMVREGLNNPLILSVCYGRRVNLAIVELIQRMARALAAFVDTDRMLCCSKELDVPFFVTHKVFNDPMSEDERKALEECAAQDPDDDLIDRSTSSMMRLALDYLRNPGGYVKQIPLAEELLQGSTFSGLIPEVGQEPALTHRQKVDVIKTVGELKREAGLDPRDPVEPGPAVDIIVDRFRDQPTPIITKAIEFTKTVAEEPTKVINSEKHWLKHLRIGPPVDSETSLTDRGDTTDVLVTFAAAHMQGASKKWREKHGGEELEDAIRKGNPAAVAVVEGQLEDYEEAAGHHRRTLSNRVTLNSTIQSLINAAKNDLGINTPEIMSTVVRVQKAPAFTPTGKVSKAKDRDVTLENEIHRLTQIKLKEIMRCPAGQPWGDGSKWDVASFHDLACDHRNQIIKVLQWHWLEKLASNSKPLADIRSGLGLPEKKVEG